MFYKSRLHILPINRTFFIAATPIIFLLLLVAWTMLNIGLTPVKAAQSNNATFAIVRRASANIRRGPGTQYGIRGTVKKGALLPVSGQYINDFGEHWYKVILRAFGDAWVSGSVVEISPANADVPIIGVNAQPTAERLPATAVPQVNSNNGSSSSNSNSGNNPPNNPPPQPTSAPPATTPDVSG